MTLRFLRHSLGRRLFRGVGRANGFLQRSQPLPADVLENDDSYLVIFDTPGVEPENLEIRYLSGHVRIRVERFRPARDGYRMRFPGRGMELDGTADLPSDAIVDPEAGTARLSEVGTVKIEIPKATPEELASDDRTAEEITIDD